MAIVIKLSQNNTSNGIYKTSHCNYCKLERTAKQNITTKCVQNINIGFSKCKVLQYFNSLSIVHYDHAKICYINAVYSEWLYKSVICKPSICLGFEFKFMATGPDTVEAGNSNSNICTKLLYTRETLFSAPTIYLPIMRCCCMFPYKDITRRFNVKIELEMVSVEYFEIVIWPMAQS